MSHPRTIALLAILLLAPARAQADPHYEPGNRVAYIREVLEALRATDRTKLQNARNYIHVIDRNSCSSAFSDLRTSCLLEAAKRNCWQRRAGRKARRRCRLVSDVIVTNKLGERAFIDNQTRYRIMSAHRDYRTEIRRELWRRYAELVTGFILTGASRSAEGELATGIDGYCRKIVKQRGLSWQYCVAATTWFIGTSQNRID